MTGFSRNPTVKRLAELADDQTIVYRSFPQRTEHVRPALRESLVLSTKYIAEVFPWIGRRRLAQGEIAYRHAEIKNPVVVLTTRLCAIISQKSSIRDRNDTGLRLE
jgi:hypothetical protein